MKFNYVLALLKNTIHKHPPEYQNEVDFVIQILENAAGYYTKHGDGLIRTEAFNDMVVFYDDNASKS